MTVATNSPSIEYVENGVTLAFTAPFRFLAASDLLVQRIAVSGTVTTLVLGVDYAVTGGTTDAGGTVTLTATSAGPRLRIRRVTARTQQTDYVTNDSFPAETHEAALDRQILIDQEQDVSEADLSARALQVPDGETIELLPARAARLGKMLGFDSIDGEPLMVPESIDAAVLRTELAGPGGAGLVGYLLGETFAVQRTVASRLAEEISIFDWLTPGEQSAVLNRTLANDLSTPLNRAMVQVNGNGGGKLKFPDGLYLGNASQLAGVQLIGNPAFRYTASDPSGGVEWRGVAAGWVLETPDGAVPATGMAVVGFAFSGLGAGTALGGLHVRKATWMNVENCYFNNFSNQGLKSESTSIACNFDRLLSTNCLLERVRAQKDGAIEIDGTDHYLMRIQANPSLNVAVPAVSDANLRVCGLVVRGAEHFAMAVHGEYADVGIHWAADKSRIVISRGDRNRGHGWEVPGNSNVFLGDHAIENGLAAANSYDDWNVSGTNNRFVALDGTSAGGQARYGVNDTSPAGEANKNYYDQTCLMLGTYGTKAWNFANLIGPSRMAPSGYPKTLTANSATPSAEGFETWRTANTAPTSITNLTNCVSGEKRKIFVLDANTTLIHNGGLMVTRTGQSRLLFIGEVVNLTLVGGVWREDGQIKVETGWAADTGAALKSAVAAYVPGAVLTYSAAYVQAEHTAAATRIQSIENALRDVTQEMKAVKDLLLKAGLVSA